ncbi:MAG: SusC/RagA family TonB-linked outer membrane protein [Tannerellaceae bacterium]|nr:SusC/RagA family TonB-linked outer membrane protein [Tannerellaceae bacterium]
MKRKHLCLLVVFLSFMRLYAQEGKVILGIVLDEAKEPMTGVTVAEKGTNNGTLTDLDGRYSIKLTGEDAILVFRFLGYETKEEKVGGKKDINLQLNPIATELTEAVVVGYGSQKKASVVGAISSLKPEELSRTSKTSITQSLVGNVAGVIAVQRSGEVGNDHADFWIRGINTFAGGSNPLIIVDGIERNFNSLDPQEIESFSVLKDASATAIYGVRGANGVIIITTKKGQVSPPQISVNIEKSFKAPTKIPKFVDAVDYMKIANEASIRTGNGELFTPSRINNTINNVGPDLYPNVNWIDELLKPMAHHQRVNLNITGGAPKARYFVSASYHNESGLFKTDTDRKWDSNIKQDQVNFRSNLDIDITSTTTVGIYLGSQLRIKNSPNISADYAWDVMMETPPYFIPKRYSDGRLAAYGAGSEKGLNPYNLLTQYGTQKYTTSDINATANVVQKLDFLTKGLEGKLAYAYDVWTEHMYAQTYTPELWYATSRDANNELAAVLVEPGNPFLNKSVWSNMAYRTYLEGSLIYNRTFNDHQVGGLFLYNHSTKGVKEGNNEYSVIPYKYQGIAARATYAWKSRYLAEFNMGYNGSLKTLQKANVTASSLLSPWVGLHQKKNSGVRGLTL